VDLPIVADLFWYRVLAKVSTYTPEPTDLPNISGNLDMEDMATYEDQEQDEELQPSLASVY
jgi:hypothetical protein